MQKIVKNSQTSSRLWSLIVLLAIVLMAFGCGGGGGGGGGGTGGTNTAPVANTGTLAATEDTAATGTLAATDADNDALTFSIVTNGTKGNVVITDAATGAYSFTPTSDENGADSFTFMVNDGTANSNVATVDISIAPVNDVPTADAGLDMTEIELTSVALSGNASDIEDGAGVTIAWTQVDTTGINVTLTDPATATPSFVTPAVIAPTTLTFRLTVTDSDSEVATSDVNVTIDNAGSLSGTVGFAPDNVDLSMAGGLASNVGDVLDWAHWGDDSPAPFMDRKTGVTQQIGVDGSGTIINDGFEVIDAGAPLAGVQSVDRDTTFAWVDGTVTGNEPGTATGVRFGPAGLQEGDGFRIKVPAGVAERSLKVYVGLLAAEGTLTASLSDGSATAFSAVIGNPSGQVHQTWEVTLNFGALADSQTLIVDFIRTNGSGGQVSLLAAALMNGTAAAPTFTPSGGIFTDSGSVELATITPNADIRYEIGAGAVVNESSNLFTAGTPIIVSMDSTITAKAFLPGFNASADAQASYLVNPSNGGSLAASVDLSSETIILSGNDWTHWGNDVGTPLDRMAGVTPQIGVEADGTPIPNGFEIIDTDADGLVSVRSVDRDVAFSWVDGTVNLTVDDSQTGLRFGPTNLDVGDGFSLSVLAGTAAKTLKLYVGLLAAEGEISASLSDASAVDFIATLENTSGLFHQTWVITIEFAAATDAQTLDIEFVRTTAGGGQVSLIAATLN